MVEFRVSRKNHRYFTYNGRHICSSVDPEHEAREWVKGLNDSLRSAKTIVVLGLGNGFHVVELEKAYPSSRIVVIETRMDMLAPCQGLQGLSMSSTDVIIAESLDVLKAQSRIKKVLQSSFAVVQYRPVTNTDAKLFEQFYELLIGRSEDSFRFHLMTRKDWLRNVNSTSDNQNADKWLGIHDLQGSLSEDANYSDYHLVQALRELVI